MVAELNLILQLIIDIVFITISFLCLGSLSNVLKISSPAKLQYPPKNRFSLDLQLLTESLLHPDLSCWKSSCLYNFQTGVDSKMNWSYAESNSISPTTFILKSLSLFNFITFLVHLYCNYTSKRFYH